MHNKSPFQDLNAITKKIEMKELDKGNIYPVTIVMDRYTGTYSGGLWLALQCNADEIPDEIGGDDGDENNFWRAHDDMKLPIGKGNTPNEALDDLKQKARKYYEKW